MKLFMMFFLFSTLSIAQTGSSSKSGESHVGQQEHNCDEPCLKCGHKEACKDTKGNDTARDKKEVQTVKPSEDHQNHQHSSSQQ